MSTPNESKTICEYDDWKIIQTENGLILQSADPSEPDQKVEEVYRFRPTEYEDKNIPELEQIVRDRNIEFDNCGELDDFSAYVFWKIMN